VSEVDVQKAFLKAGVLAIGVAAAAATAVVDARTGDTR
jgi:hypothetical protein